MTDAPALYGVFGHPIGHSLSPVIHTAAFEALNLNAQYDAYDYANAHDALRVFCDRGLKGASITLPLKVALFETHEAIPDDNAVRLGCINTLLRIGDTIRGYNTDGLGALRALQHGGGRLDHATILFIGSGGAARGIAWQLVVQNNYRPFPLDELLIAGRTPEHVTALVENLVESGALGPVRCRGLSLAEAPGAARDATVVIQCTSVGMAPHADATPLAPDAFRPGQVVMDIVYTPRRTQFLQDAEAAGATIIEGHNMFLYQAVRQQELWFPERSPADRETATEAMRAALETALP